MEKDKFYSKAVLVAFVSFYLIYIGLLNNTEYGVFYTIYQPVYMSGPFMLLVFVLTYVLASTYVPKVEEVKEEAQEVKEEENVNEQEI